jgi:hypothetical protein
MTRPAAHSYGDRFSTGHDPLTDSGVHRFAMGTQVRLHLHNGGYVDCGLLDIDTVSTWNDLVLLVTKVMPVVVLGPRRHAFASGVVLHVECISDPDPAAQ